MRLLHLLSLALLSSLASAADEPKHAKPCTVTSPKSRSFFDLSSLALHPPDESKKKSKDERTESWLAQGHDYGVNFTMNFCAPVVEDLKDVAGLDKDEWRNVSAFYKEGKRTYSLGRSSTEPIFRGRKLVLNFTHGSPCDDDDVPRKREIIDVGDKKEHGDRKGAKADALVRRKSTLVSFLCEKDAYDSSKPKVAVSFVGASPDQCAYFFEARSPYSCGGASQAEQDVGPGGVFGIIALIAVSVYLLGGIAYQRAVMHQRGWRQLPNYAAWAAAGAFCRDAFFTLFSSCAKPFSRRRRGGAGYSQLPTQGDGYNGYAGRGRTPTRDDENRLIDQLDEEWDE